MGRLILHRIPRYSITVKKVSLSPSISLSYTTIVVVIAIIIIYDTVMIMRNYKAPSGS